MFLTHVRHSIVRMFVSTVVLVAPFAVGVVPAHAAEQVVTNCSDDAQLSSLLAAGGTITFACGSALIHLSSTKTISSTLTIDGGGLISLSGDNARQLFEVGSTGALTLRNIVLSNGFTSGDGGAISNRGMLTMETSTIRNSESGASGGAIVSYGPLTITNSLLEGNHALNGGALYPRWSGAQTTIVGSVLRDNHATDMSNQGNGLGGAILAWDGASVTVTASDIYSNTAWMGGAIYNFANSVLTLRENTRLHGNVAGADGGGLVNEGSATLTNVTVSNNTASIYDGGGIENGDAESHGVLSLTDVTIAGNAANGFGGGIDSYNGTVTLSNVTLSANSSNRSGGGIFSYNSTLTLVNSTLSGNSTNFAGGGIYSHNSGVMLTNVTFSGNAATSSVGRGGGIAYDQGSVTLKNTIIANSLAGGNCASGVTSAGFNLSSDGTCGFGSVRDNVTVLLGPLSDNGGSTQTHMPLAGSPAIDHGADCPATDQRGISRPIGPACDIGAIEAELPIAP